MAPIGRLVAQATQGYMVDRRTAAAHGIRELADLGDPEKAALFDLTGDGKADLIGCPKTWSCAEVIDHQLKAFELDATVNHIQDNYDQRMLDAVKRVRMRQPVLFYTWTPYWVTSKLNPAQQVRWLDVPFSSLPPPRERVDTALPDGSNPGFMLNNIRVVANPAFLAANPKAAELFRQARIPIEDISYQNQQMQLGENALPDIERHARQWIAGNRAAYDSWLAAARKR
jgi:glycine betaine/proline transport system substrate-binding protein